MIQSAIWETNGFVKIENPESGNASYKVRMADANEKNAFKAITIEKILEDSGRDRIGILKLDIEGAEKELFESNYKNWIEKVDVLIIELHDRIKQSCAVSFFSVIDKEPFHQFSKGENFVYVRKGLN